MVADRPDCPTHEAAAWFAGRVPDEWFAGPLSVLADRDEIIVIGALAAPRSSPDGEDALRVAATARVEAFREETRAHRMKIAEAGQARWQRHVSWGVVCGPVEQRFTTASVPVMTRLRYDERQVLDTLVDAGVARSRSDAIAWCVNQVGQHRGEWIDRLRTALVEVERIRAEGSGASEG